MEQQAFFLGNGFVLLADKTIIKKKELKNFIRYVKDILSDNPTVTHYFRKNNMIKIKN